MSLPIRNFPQPDAMEQQQIDLVIRMLKKRITENKGQIRFFEFMDFVLHSPQFGYYNTGSWKFGPGGDFVTAPQLGKLFGYCLANQCYEALQLSGGKSILELGAGTGALCLQILERLDQIGFSLEHYYILETSGDLRERQQELIQSSTTLADKVVWLNDLDSVKLSGVVVANEVFDVLPVDRIEVANTGYHSLDVSIDDGQLQWKKSFHEHSDDKIQHLTERYNLPTGYRTEFSPTMNAVLKTINDVLETGYCVFSDYAYSGAEYYHPQRTEGTLRCYYKHVAHDDPLIFPGIQDITAHVDMTALAESAIDCGFDIVGFVTQSSFLVNNGLLDGLADYGRSTEVQLSLSNEIKRLTLPTEMGEVFKVLALGKSIECGLQGFANGDRIHSLQLSDYRP